MILQATSLPLRVCRELIMLFYMNMDVLNTFRFNNRFPCYLDGEFDVVAQVRSNAVPAIHLGHVKEDLSYHVGALDEPEIILQAVDHALNQSKD